MDEQTKNSIKLLGTLSPHFDIYALAGNRNSKSRQALMLALTGEKLPISKCGVNALTKQFYLACNIVGDCLASRETAFANLCKLYVHGAKP